jgi:hypothetical protein
MTSQPNNSGNNPNLYSEIVRAERSFRSLVTGFLAGYPQEPTRTHVIRLTKNVCQEWIKELDDSPPSSTPSTYQCLEHDAMRAHWRRAYLQNREAILERQRVRRHRHKPPASKH